MSTVKMLLLAILAFGGLAFAQGERRDRLGDPLPSGAVQRLGNLRMHYPSFPCLAYLPDGRAIVTQGGRLDICDMAQGERVSSTKVSDAGLISVQTRSDGKALLIGDSAGKVREWDVERKAEVRSWDTGIRGLCSVCYSTDETGMLVAGSTPPVMTEWELDSGRKLIEIKSEMVSTRNGAIYGPGGKTAILGGGFEHNLERYDLGTGQLLKKWCSIYQAKRLALSPDQTCVAVGVEDRAVEWSLEDYKALRTFKHCPGEAARVYALPYVPATNEVLCGARDGAIYKWSRDTGKLVSSWTPHQSTVEPLCVSSDQKWALSWGSGRVAETNIATGAPRLTWDRHAGSVEAVAFLPDGHRAVSGSSDATLRVWDVQRGETVRVIEGAALGAYAVAISPDGACVAAGCKDGKVREFTLADGKLVRELAGHLGFIRAVAYTPDGEHGLSAGRDGCLRKWSLKTGKMVFETPNRGWIYALSCVPDGKTAYTASGTAIYGWDTATGEQKKSFSGHQSGVLCLSLSRDGQRLVSGSADTTLLVWEVN